MKNMKIMHRTFWMDILLIVLEMKNKIYESLFLTYCSELKSLSEEDCTWQFAESPKLSYNKLSKRLNWVSIPLVTPGKHLSICLSNHRFRVLYGKQIPNLL